MEVKYCPYCGTKLMSETKICDHCGQEIAFTEQGSLNNDSFDEMWIERKAAKTGRIYAFLGFIFTIVIFLMITLLMLSGTIKSALLVTYQLLTYESMVGDIVCIILALRLNKKLKKYNYNSLGPCNATIWVSLFGLAFGALFITLTILKLIGV